MLKKLLTPFLILSFVVQFSVPVAMISYHSYTQKKASKVGEKYTFKAIIQNTTSEYAVLCIDFFGKERLESKNSFGFSYDIRLDQNGTYGILKTDKDGIATIDQFSTEKPAGENYIEVPEEAKKQFYYNSVTYTAHGSFRLPAGSNDSFLSYIHASCTVTAYLHNGKLTLDRLYIDDVYAEDYDWSKLYNDPYTKSTEVNSDTPADLETTAPETGTAV